MTILVTDYLLKRDLRKSVGQRLKYKETSVHGLEYRSDGRFPVIRRPTLMGGGTEWGAVVTMERDIIVDVK